MDRKEQKHHVMERNNHRRPRIAFCLTPHRFNVKLLLPHIIVRLLRLLVMVCEMEFKLQIQAIMPELHLTVVAASNLIVSADGSSGGDMNVFALVWIDPAMKLSTRPHGGGGCRFPVWNDALVFDHDVLPHNSSITIQVVSQGLGSRRSSLLGTAELPLAEVTRMKAMRENPEDPDAVLLQLVTPTNHVQGSISLSISLVSGISHGWGTSRLMGLVRDQSAPVMGYPVAMVPAYEMQAWSGDMQAHHGATHLSSHIVRLGSCGVGCVTVAGIGGAIAGFVIRDILAVFF